MAPWGVGVNHFSMAGRGGWRRERGSLMGRLVGRVVVRNEVGEGSVRVGRMGQDGESVVVVLEEVDVDLEEHRRGGQRSALAAATRAGR